MNQVLLTQWLAATLSFAEFEHATIQLLGPFNADSTSFLVLGTYKGDTKPSSVHRVTVEVMP